MPLIEIDNFSYSYPGAVRPALKDLSLRVRKGEFVAVIGANNSGKSSLCYALTGVIPQLFHGKAQGSVRVCGNSSADLSLAELALSVAFVMQKPANQLCGVRFTVAEEVAFSLENQGVPRDDILRRVNSALSMTGLSDLAGRSPHHLSGGQLQRVAIASALVCDAPVLVLDEPTTYLDPKGVQDVFEILSRLKEDGRTIVLAEQRLESIAEHADRVLALHEGAIVMDGTPDEVLSAPLLKDIGLDWTRYTRVSELALKNCLWRNGCGLATTFTQTVRGLDRG
ncbi:energy-coupling factor ABC transporter ATP-binding protein [Maridesulfovibrio sp. FT414]|uniref:energy-coupling factor ABC transporter ATP-binding protein n=1 Tax=Maridesulfovibrio sp. FT414 TaxID=2979469 RepID=UPI003D803C8F